MIKSDKIKEKIKRKGKTCQGIIKFELNKYEIFVYEGTISKYDIIVKYKNEELKRKRTPKHIHWVVDILLKLQNKKESTRDLLKLVQKYWDNCLPLTNNDFKTLNDVVHSGYQYFNKTDFNDLSNFGEYEIEFLCVLWILLIHQEKTNNKQAYMFKSIIDKLLEEEIDIYSIISVATHGGRK